MRRVCGVLQLRESLVQGSGSRHSVPSMCALPFDLSPDGLIRAYINGFFPMAENRHGEIGWFRPEMRGAIELDNLRVSRSLRKVIRDQRFKVSVDDDFPAVIRLCGELRDETWISDEIEQAYIRLHSIGFAHSVECRVGPHLVGGLYGVSINGAFFGESMFQTETDASKVALVFLVEHMRDRGMVMLDTQYLTPHLESLGGIEIGREEYERRLERALSAEVSFSDDTPRVLVGRMET